MSEREPRPKDEPEDILDLGNTEDWEQKFELIAGEADTARQDEEKNPETIQKLKREIGEEFEGQENLPELLTGKETAELVNEISEDLSPELKEILLHSNVALVLAGLKPMTEFFIEVPEDKDVSRHQEEINTLNKSLEKVAPHIKFNSGMPITSKSNGIRNIMATVSNLEGFERMTKTTNIEGIPTFDSNEGWEGYDKWLSNTLRNIEETYPNKDEQSNIQAGSFRGYPDVAILDLIDAAKNGKTIKDLTTSRIPYTGLYEEAQPNYYFYPEHTDNEDIQQNIAQAGEILLEFYETTSPSVLLKTITGQKE